MIKQSLILFSALLIIIFSSCQHTTNDASKNDSGKNAPEIFQFISPANGSVFKCGDTIKVQLSILNKAIKIDSIVAYLGKNSYRTTNGSTEIDVFTNDELPGSKSISVSAFYKDTNQTSSFAVMMLSDIVPEKLSYKLINTFPHDPKHFTEGLFFYENNLFEGTGEWNESGVFKSELKTGKILKEVSIPRDVFGEGISIVGNNLYELTYQSGVGYIYNKNTFEKIRTFNFPMQTEGWGMTTDNKDLIMSNGSDKLFYWDTTCTTVKKEIQIFDNVNSVDSLNEIEYVNGIIYSNVWQQNIIVKIDAATGKVLGYLDLTNLVPLENRESRDNVLNGIAYNEKSKTFYVTGKRWKQLFEIKIGD